MRGERRREDGGEEKREEKTTLEVKRRERNEKENMTASAGQEPTKQVNKNDTRTLCGVAGGAKQEAARWNTKQHCRRPLRARHMMV